MTPEQRRLSAQIAANTRWANTADRAAAMEPARRGLANKFEREADPEGVLPPLERAKRAANLKKAFYQRMALKSSQVRVKDMSASRGEQARELLPTDGPETLTDARPAERESVE